MSKLITFLVVYLSLWIVSEGGKDPRNVILIYRNNELVFIIDLRLY